MITGSLLLILFLGLCLFSPHTAFPRSHLTKRQQHKSLPKSNQIKIVNKGSTTLQMFLLPQIGFVATCVGTIVAYIYFNIDDIRNKQNIAIGKAITQQTNDIKSAQDLQKQAIESAMKKQQESILKGKQAADEAKRRADEATRRQ
eukprot:gene12753-26859_t